MIRSNFECICFILHFDINKTLIVSDKGIPTEKMVNSILSESIWGYVSKLAPPYDLTDWVIYSPSASTCAPEPGLVTFSDFVEFYMLAERSKKKELKCNFVTNGPGHSCLSLFNRIMLGLTIPSHLRASCKQYEFLTNDKYFILPSFFRLLQKLEGQNLNYRIVFRSFGSDIESVKSEYNLFFDGLHPIFQLVPGSENIAARKKIPENIISCKYKRQSPAESDVILTVSSLSPVGICVRFGIRRIQSSALRKPLMRIINNNYVVYSHIDLLVYSGRRFSTSSTLCPCI